MDIYQYKDYDEYVKVQTEVSHSKKDWTFAKPRVIKAVVKSKKWPSSILCHGVRNGAEALMFMSELPYVKVVGTELAFGCEKLFENTLKKYMHEFPQIPHNHSGSVVQWDMQKANPAWIGKFDIVYSNSFDHCIYPEETLKVWHDQLTPSGSVFVEYSEQQSIGNKDDPLGATDKEVLTMMRSTFSEVTILKESGMSASRIFRGDK